MHACFGQCAHTNNRTVQEYLSVWSPYVFSTAQYATYIAFLPTADCVYTCLSNLRKMSYQHNTVGVSGFVLFWIPYDARMAP